MSEEIYTKDEHYQDWKSENLKCLKDEFLEDNKLRFEEYCKQAFKDKYSD